MDAITVITTPRSGAGHLFALLRNVEDAAPRDDLFAAGHAEAGARLDRAEAEARAEGRTILVVKATTALPREVMEREVLNRIGMRAVLVVRRQIDAYVSLAKATAMNAWRDTDLSGVKVKLDPEHFARWMEAEEAWYAHWKAWLERRAFPVPILRYETDLMLPAESSLRRFAAAADQLGLTLRVPASLAHEGLRKQDRHEAPAARIKNWFEFSNALARAGLEQRAYGYPI